MTEPLPDVDQLPNVKLTPEQDARAVAMAKEMTREYLGSYSAARVIVHLQDEVAFDQKDLAELRPCYSMEGLIAFVARHFPAMELRPRSGCPVIFDRAGRCGMCTACGKNFTCGAKLGALGDAQAEEWPGQAKYKPGPGGNNI